MFIFVRCLRSAAAVTPAKYELDIMQVTAVLIIRKNWESNGTEKIGLVTPPPGNGTVPSGNKSLPDPMLTLQISNAILHHWTTPSTMKMYENNQKIMTPMDMLLELNFSTSVKI